MDETKPLKVTETKTGQFRITIPIVLARAMDIKKGSRLRCKIKNNELVISFVS